MMNRSSTMSLAGSFCESTAFTLPEWIPDPFAEHPITSQPMLLTRPLYTW
jgi:hypothetical protein